MIYWSKKMSNIIYKQDVVKLFNDAIKEFKRMHDDAKETEKSIYRIPLDTTVKLKNEFYKRFGE